MIRPLRFLIPSSLLLCIIVIGLLQYEEREKLGPLPIRSGNGARQLQQVAEGSEVVFGERRFCGMSEVRGLLNVCDGVNTRGPPSFAFTLFLKSVPDRLNL
jgi:hypothetical protein